MFRVTTKIRTVCFLAAVFFLLAGIDIAYSSPMPGFSWGGASEEEANLDLCPQGVLVVNQFLQAWQNGDYRTMYELIDDESKKGYTYEQATFDFQFMEFKEYRISYVRRRGDDYEMLLSYGDWKDGQKQVVKVLISGETYKIIMQSSNSPFKKSLESYF
ncbi:MAG: hypothetical protein GF409_08635 [Candidatus Omnitrophica bacterium]|nr:hypothetical protein [Candidatus Omnitrophota bacterium]